MTEGSEATADSTPAGTACALCGTDLSPRQYPDCRAVMIDESGPGGEAETVQMICAECWRELDGELTDPSESSTRA